MTIAAFLLIYGGIAAKSAQWPLHYWLPGAMLAPTPISAYLHSAAMVKAGIYLLARIWPSLSHLDLWPWLVIGVGSVTMVLGAWIALQRDVLKQILAYTTISQLGLLAVAFGLSHFNYDGKPNVIWGNAQVLNHALYKAPLFMLAGAVTHALGIKALSGLRGAWHVGGERRLYAILFLAAMVALAALPGTFSFGAKEAFLYQIWHAYKATDSIGPLLLMVGTVFVSFCNVAIAVRFAQTLLSREPAPEAHGHGHDSPFWTAMLWVPAAGLLAIQFAGGILGPVVASLLLNVEATPFYPSEPTDLFSLWYVITHPSVPLLASVIGVAGGVLLGLSGLWRGIRGDLHDGIFPSVYAGILSGGGLAFGALQTGRLRGYAFVTLLTMALGMAYVATLDAGWFAILTLPIDAWHLARAAPGGQLPSFMTTPEAWLLCGLVVGGALSLVLVRNRAARVLLLGATGFGVTGVFYFYQAPDLALTQLSVEIVSLVLFLLVLTLLPDDSPKDRSWLPARFVLALAVGATAAAATLLASAGIPPARPALLADGSAPANLGDYYLRNSYHGIDSARVDADRIGSGVVNRGPGHVDSFGTKDPAEFVDQHPQGETVVNVHKGGGGSNVVNVILVDFRSFDTYGEVAVLGLAALGVWTLLRRPPSEYLAGETDNRSGPDDPMGSTTPVPTGRADDAFIDPYSGPSRPMSTRPRGFRAVGSERISSPVLKTASKLLVPLAVVFAAFLFFKGHQSPGGGFVGGLATAVALIVFRMCFGCEALYRLLPVRERMLIGLGLLAATLAAVIPLFLGLPLLSSTHGYLPLPGGGTFHWATVLLFDLGVYLIVVGSVVGMIDALARELE
jgi:multicomponent K+:H+ antiporter subunit A